MWTGEGRRHSKMEEWDEGGGMKGDMEQVREGVTEVETISHSHFQIILIKHYVNIINIMFD